MTRNVCIVTGGNSGIGYHVALELARLQHHVILACRNPALASSAVVQIARETGNKHVEWVKLDLMNLGSVRRMAKKFLARGLPLHLLVNNAGIMAVPFALSNDGYESQLQVNFLASHLLTSLLAPCLIKSAPSRVVFVSSVAHHFHRSAITPSTLSILHNESSKDYIPFAAYYRSKRYTLTDSQSWAERLSPHQVIVNAVHPGTVSTGLFRYLDATYGSHMGRLIRSVGGWALTRPARGARSVLFPCTSEHVVEGGKYYVPYGSAQAPNSVSQEEREALWAWAESVTQIGNAYGGAPAGTPAGGKKKRF